MTTFTFNPADLTAAELRQLKWNLMNPGPICLSDPSRLAAALEEVEVL
jgi:hypothetical protein